MIHLLYIWIIFFSNYSFFSYTYWQKGNMVGNSRNCYFISPVLMIFMEVGNYI